ncbi:MAG TPA: type II toxin-antitoxin system PemK/MazF family toxin [Gemmatimonadales bacterium]|nr:type II toxin-antitoxin system PemK/MazF family toxin [Gemmatimonadales bacterium]
MVLVWFPHSDLTTVTRRPALVVQADDLATGIAQVVVAMITSNLARRGHPSRVSITLSSPADASSGLLADSVVMTDNLATISTRALASVIGTLPDLSAVDTALRHTLGL